MSATPAPVLAPAKVGQFTPVPTFGERINGFTGQQPLLVWVLGLSGFGLLVSVVVMEIRRRIGTTQIGHRPATVTGLPLHDDETVEETPALQIQKRFVGGPPQVSVQLKASESSPRRAVIPVAKRVADTMATPRSQPETATVNGRTSKPAYVDFEESSGGPVIEQVPANGQTEIAPAPPAFPSPTYIEPTFAPAVESVIEPSIEPAIEQAEPEPVAATAEKSVPSEPVREGGASEPVEAPASVLEMRVSEPTTAETAVPSEIEEQISTQEWSPEPEPEPIEQGQPLPYQTVVTAEEPAEIAVREEREIATVAEITGVGRAIAGISALPEAPEISTARDEEHFAPQPTTIETMPETLQTPTAPVIRTSGGPTQPAHTAPAPQAAAGGMHTAVQVTLSCEIASMQLTPTFKMGALQLRPISKVVTMRLASSPQQQAPMNLQANFEISKIQAAPGSLGQLRLNPSQQQRPAMLATPSFDISGLQLVSGFESAPLQLTPSHQTPASVHLTAAFQITSVEVSPTFEIAGIILNSTSKTVAVQLPGASSVENAPMFEITNVQMADNGEIAMLQLNPVTKRA
jgi:hypothetical protein